MQEREKALDALLGMGGGDATYLSRHKLLSIYGPEMPGQFLRSIGGLVTVTSSPAGLIYYYIKHLGMTLTDWCYPKVDSAWYCAVDTHYKPTVLLEDNGLQPGPYRLLDYEVVLRSLEQTVSASPKSCDNH